MATTTAPNPIIERAIEDCLQCLHWCSACVDAALTCDPSAMAGSIRLLPRMRTGMWSYRKLAVVEFPLCAPTLRPLRRHL